LVTSRPRILVADDDKLVQSAFTDILEYSGYTVIPAWDGDEALAKAQAEQPDLVLLDIMMPKRNGIQVAQDLKENPATSSIPIIIVTALSGTPAAQITRAEVYLQKPVRPGDLLERVRRLLATRGREPEVLHGTRAGA
jgi:CheY-like chemotaxis protein